MEEPLSVNDLMKKKQRIDWRRFLKGAGIGLLVLGMLVAAMRVYLRSQLGTAISIDVMEDFTDTYYYNRSLFPDSLLTLFLWGINMAIVQPLLFPSYTKPFVPYLGAAIAFAISGGAIADSDKPARWLWLIASIVAVIGYIILQILLFIVGVTALD